jgi:hypothetical protein
MLGLYLGSNVVLWHKREHRYLSAQGSPGVGFSDPQTLEHSLSTVNSVFVTPVPFAKKNLFIYLVALTCA